MTLTTPERLLVNGHDMKTLASNVETLAATLRAAGKRGSNVVAGGRHGSIFTARKRHDENLLVWPIWVLGCDEDGLIPGGETDRTMFFQNYDELLRVMAGEENSELEIKHHLPDGTVRVGYGEVQNVIDPVTSGTSPLARVTFEIVMSDPFWTEEEDFEAELLLGPDWLLNTEWDITELLGGNAPVDNAELEVWSPSNNMVLLSGSQYEVALAIDGDGYGPAAALKFDIKTGRIYSGSFNVETDRFNNHTNPCAGANTTGWANASGIGGALSRQLTGYSPVKSATYIQSTASGTGIFHIRTFPWTDADTSNNHFGSPAGRTYTWSVFCRLKSASPSASLGFILRVAFYNGATSISQVDSAPVTCIRSTNDTTDNTAWQRVSVTATVPANCTRIDMTPFTGTAAAGDVINLTGAMIEEAGALDYYFDGGYPTCFWSGTAHNSMSARNAFSRRNLHTNPSAGSNVTGYGNNGGVGGAPVRGTGGYTVDGKTGYTRWTAGSAGDIQGLLLPTGISDFFNSYVAGRTYVWSCYVRFRGVSDPTRNMRIYAAFFNPSGSAGSSHASAVTAIPHTASVNSTTGWTRLSFTGAVPATTTHVYFVLEATNCDSGDIVEADAVMVEDGAVLGSYFDGQSPKGYWNGSQYNSDSYISVVTAPTVWTELGDWQYIGHSGDTRYLYLAPALDGHYRIKLSGSIAGSTGDTKLILRAARRFRSG